MAFKLNIDLNFKDVNLGQLTQDASKVASTNMSSNGNDVLGNFDVSKPNAYGGTSNGQLETVDLSGEMDDHKNMGPLFDGKNPSTSFSSVDGSSKSDTPVFGNDRGSDSIPFYKEDVGAAKDSSLFSNSSFDQDSATNKNLSDVASDKKVEMDSSNKQSMMGGNSTFGGEQNKDENSLKMDTKTNLGSGSNASSGGVGKASSMNTSSSSLMGGANNSNSKDDLSQGKINVGFDMSNISAFTNPSDIVANLKVYSTINNNFKNSTSYMTETIRSIQLKNSLAVYGFRKEDIKRILDGIISVEELVYEIQTSEDNSRRRDMMYAAYLQAYELDYYNMDDFKVNIEIDKKNLALLRAEMRQASKKEVFIFFDLLARFKNGEDLNTLMNTPVAWEYVDEFGVVQYKYDYPSMYDEDIEYRPRTFGELYGDERFRELREIAKENTTYSWSDTPLQKEYFQRLIDEYDKASTENSELQRNLEERIGELENQIASDEYIYSLITSNVTHYMENIDPYTTRSDFSQNCSFDIKATSTVEGLKNRVADATKVSTYSDVRGLKDYHVKINNKDEIVDLIACMINDKDTSFICQDIVKSDDSLLEHYKKWFNFVSEDERDVFNYIYNTKGKEEAYDYLVDISSEMDLRWLAQRTKEDQEFANSHPVLSSIASIVITPIEGISAASASLYSLINEEKICRSDVYSSGDVWRAQVASDIAMNHGEGWSFAYSTGMSMADSMSLIGLSLATGGMATPALSATLMGSRAYVSTLNEALDRGLRDSDAMLLAAVSGVVETAMESYSVGHLLNLEEKLGKSTISMVGKIGSHIENPVLKNLTTKSFYVGASALSQGLAEGEEEFATEILNYVADIFVSKDLSNYTKSIEQYLKLGYTEDEAVIRTMDDFKNQAGQAFLGGFVSGICFGSFGGVSSTIKTSNAIAKDMYSQFNGSKPVTNFAEALQINEQQISDITEITEKVKQGQQITENEANLLINGTVLMQSSRSMKTDLKNKLDEAIAKPDVKIEVSDTISHKEQTGVPEKEVASGKSSERKLTFSVDQINKKCNYDQICQELLSLVDDEMKGLLESILYEGMSDNYRIKSDFVCRDNPLLEGQRRVAMASLAIRNPETFEYFKKHNINTFRGTNSRALPNILKYGMNSQKALEDLSVPIFTGEAWSRQFLKNRGLKRGFVSFTDVLDIAQNYASYLDIASDYASLASQKEREELAFPIIFGVSESEMKKQSLVNVESDVSEIGVKDHIPLESISCICVPDDKVEIAKSMLGNIPIDVLAMGDLDQKGFSEFEGEIDVRREVYEKKRMIAKDVRSAHTVDSIENTVYNAQSGKFNTSVLNIINENNHTKDNMFQYITELREGKVDLPEGYDSMETYRRDFVRTLIESGTIDTLSASSLYMMIFDVSMFDELIGCNRLSLLFSTNLKNPNIQRDLVERLSSRSVQEFSTIFENASLKECIKGMTVQEISTILKIFSEYNCPYPLIEGAFVDRLIEMEIDDFYYVIREASNLAGNLENVLDTPTREENCSRLLDAIISKYYTEETVSEDLSRSREMGSFLPLMFGDDTKIKRQISTINSTQYAITSKIRNMLMKSSDIGLEGNGIPVSNEYEYYDVTIEVDGKNETVTFSNFDGFLDVQNNFLNNEYYASHILQGKFRIKDVSVNLKKSNLVFTSKNGLGIGLNEVVLLLDGQEYRTVILSDSEYMDFSYSMDERISDVNTVELVSIKCLGSLNAKVEDENAIYKVNIDIEGAEREIYMTINQSLSSELQQPMLDIDGYVEKNNLLDIRGVKVEKVEASTIGNRILKTSDYRAFKDIFKQEKYGGNQSDISTLLKEKYNGTEQTSINKTKAELLDNLINKYFPDATEIQRINIASDYEQHGCGWMGIANAFMTYLGSAENGAQLFKDRIGFDMAFEDGDTISYNLEALVFDMYLSYNAKLYGRNVDALCEFRQNSGVSIGTFESQIGEYFRERGFDIKGESQSCTSVTTEKTRNEMFKNILNNQNMFYILAANKFDLKLPDGETGAISGDLALSNAETDGLYKRRVGEHMMLITDITEDLNFVVSSWGKKYEFLTDSIERNKKSEDSSHVNVWSIKFDIPDIIMPKVANKINVDDAKLEVFSLE